MEFEINGRQFRAAKLSALEQWTLSRKIAPLLPPLAPLIIKISQSGDLLNGANVLAIAELATPFAQALAGLKDEDAEDILTITLSSVKVLTDVAKNVWVPLWVPAAKMASVLELNDITELLPIALRVIQFNLGNFINGVVTRHGQTTPESSGVTSLKPPTTGGASH